MNHQQQPARGRRQPRRRGRARGRPRGTSAACRGRAWPMGVSLSRESSPRRSGTGIWWAWQDEVTGAWCSAGRSCCGPRTARLGPPPQRDKVDVPVCGTTACDASRRTTLPRLLLGDVVRALRPPRSWPRPVKSIIGTPVNRPRRRARIGTRAVDGRLTSRGWLNGGEHKSVRGGTALQRGERATLLPDTWGNQCGCSPIGR